MKEDGQQANHPLAPRMCLIAFLSYNLIMGCMFGSFGVLVKAVEAKMGVNRDLSSLGLPCVMVGLSLMSPMAGILAGKFSIRLLMMTGVLLNIAGYVVLALSGSIVLNLFAYGLLIGPGQALSAIVLPSTLVTRWYAVNRGRALGLISMPVIPVAMPLMVTAVLHTFGLSVAYGLLAGILALLLVPLMFVVDYPPGAPRLSGDREIPDVATGLELPVMALLRRGSFWSLALAGAAVISTATVFAAHIVPMAMDWGFDATRAASLLSFAPLAGMAGAVTFGWLTDRLGGARTLALLCINSAILWAVLLLHPPYVILALVAALMGLLGAGVIPTFGMALSQQFGQATFSRAFGLGYMMALPFNVLGVPAAAHVYVLTGSYAYAFIGIIVFLLVAMIGVATMRRSRACNGLNHRFKGHRSRF